MLQTAKKKSDRIHQVLQIEQCLFLVSEKGIIRIWPQSERIIRVSYTENGIFSCRQGEEFSDISGSCVWGHEEDERQVRVFTDCLWVIIQRETGSIRYEDRERGLLLKEKDKLSKTVEEFDSYKLVVNEQTAIEEIHTADGKKRVVRSGEKVFHKKLYHTKISFDFQQGEALYGLGQSQEGLLDLRGSVQYLHQGNMVMGEKDGSPVPGRS